MFGLLKTFKHAGWEAFAFERLSLDSTHRSNFSTPAGVILSYFRRFLFAFADLQGAAA
jgi:hypothetical protein